MLASGVDYGGAGGGGQVAPMKTSKQHACKIHVLKFHHLECNMSSKYSFISCEFPVGIHGI